MDRRRFLQTTAAGGTLISIGVAPVGCGNPVSPAPLAKVTTLTAPDKPLTIKEAVVFDNPAVGKDTYGTVQLLVEFYPQLAADRGAITLQLGKEIVSTDQLRGYQVPIDNTILVIHQDGQFIAVQSSCPHARCPLGYNPNAKPEPLIECPCHSSRFFTTGANNQCVGGVEHPPANGGLQQWQATASTVAGQTVLKIDLKLAEPCGCEMLPPVDAARKVTLPFADFPQLMMPGGSVCGQPMGVPNPIIVSRLDATTVVAVDSTCTHLACTVAWNAANQDFECPCHGSIFASDGAVKMGPATTPLTSYAATLEADSVVLTIP